MIGVTVSHYRITEHLGGGGMGVVYQADDLRLGRPVALKFLPARLSVHPEAERRFEQEARAASALDHPNICTIHDIDRSEPTPDCPRGMLFMVMAFYEGETLKKKIARGTIAVNEALDYARQIAEGLLAAHRAGIVHRDLKPANVMVTLDGRAIVLDFGVAKLAGEREATDGGAIVGTVSYVSPEQARGEPVDHRTDIWSLGVVLYEMLTGRCPFRGRFESDVKRAIEHDVPEPAGLVRSEIPPELDRILDCMLEKSPSQRYATLEALLFDLEGLHALRLGEGAKARLVGYARSAKRWWRRGNRLPAAVALTLLLVLSIAAAWYAAREPGPRAIAGARQITTSGANVDAPSWSPSGDRLIFGSDRGGDWDIWEIDVADRSARNLTEPGAFEDLMPSWSPDGSRIAFIRRGSTAAMHVMSYAGANPKRVADIPSDFVHPPAWSANGRSLAIAGVSGAQIVDLDDAKVRDLVLAGELNRLELCWSHSGDRFAYVEASDRGSPTSVIWLTDVESGDSRRLTDGSTWDFNPVFSPDDRSIFFISDRGGGKDVWHLRINRRGEADGSPERLTNGLEARYLAVAPDGERLAVTIDRSDTAVWRLPLLDGRRVTWQDREIVAEGLKPVRQPDLSPDQKSLVLDAEQTGIRDLWILSLEDGQLHPVSPTPTRGVNAAWSPDGTRIAYHTGEGAHRAIWILDLPTGRKSRLVGDEPYAPGEHIALVPRWSPDGRLIAFHTGGDPLTDGADVWVAPVEGGGPRRLTGPGADDRLPQFTADGAHVLFRSDRSGSRIPWIISTEGGEARPLVGMEGSNDWRVHGDRLYYTRETPLGVEFYEREIAGGPERQLTSLATAEQKGSLGGYVVADDALIVLWQRDLADIWVMELER